MLPLPVLFVLLTANHGHHPEVSLGSAYQTMQECQSALKEAEAADRGHNKCVRYYPQVRSLDWR
jgi:hypothetical protein